MREIVYRYPHLVQGFFSGSEIALFPLRRTKTRRV